MGYYSIKDLETLTGIKAHTIRMWEQRYDIIKPARTDTNIRLYEADQLKLMLNISMLNNHGFKISKIASMTREELYEKVREMTNKIGNYEDQINALTVTMIDLDEDAFEKIISTSIMQYGFEKTMIMVIYPFLIRIGALWTTDAVNPAQEHFITNLIRQKLIVAIDGQFEPNRTNPKKFMLFLPDGELHEIGLLFCYYLVKSRGNKVIYLGQSLPMDALHDVYQVHKPDFISSIITSTPSSEDIQTYVTSLGQKFPSAHFLLSGYQVVGQDLKLERNMTVINQIQDLINILDELKVGRNPFVN